jgi:carnosine N-methyltransferase
MKLFIYIFHFRVHSWNRIQDAEKSYTSLPERHKQLIPKFCENLDDIKLCIDHNYEVIKLIVETTAGIFENADHKPENVRLKLHVDYSVLHSF